MKHDLVFICAIKSNQNCIGNSMLEGTSTYLNTSARILRQVFTGSSQSDLCLHYWARLNRELSLAYIPEMQSRLIDFNFRFYVSILFYFFSGLLDKISIRVLDLNNSATHKCITELKVQNDTESIEWQPRTVSADI